MRKDSEIVRMKDAILSLQDVESSLSIRGDFCEELKFSERAKFFKENAKWLAQIGDKLVKIRNEIQSKQKTKEYDN